MALTHLLNHHLSNLPRNPLRPKPKANNVRKIPRIQEPLRKILNLNSKYSNENKINVERTVYQFVAELGCGVDGACLGGFGEFGGWGLEGVFV